MRPPAATNSRNEYMVGIATSARARRTMACDSRESSKSICKEIALQRPKSGKFDYLCAPSHSAHSMVSEFFTDDDVALRHDAVHIPRPRLPDEDRTLPCPAGWR